MSLFCAYIVNFELIFYNIFLCNFERSYDTIFEHTVLSSRQQSGVKGARMTYCDSVNSCFV